MIARDELLWIDRSDRERLTLTGPDRAKFLHNYCTNDIKKLTAGRGCEAFITSLQGKTIGYVTVLAGEAELLLRTDPGGWTLVLPHFAKYGVFDEVAWRDDRESTYEIHLLGDRAESVIAGLGIPLPGSRTFDHAIGSREGSPVLVIRESPFGLPGFTLTGPLTDRSALVDAFLGVAASPVHELTPDEADGLRIEAGTPIFGRDLTAENLPQEIGRDALAISFVKGCYLGQETVARIDALGHVNKILKGFRDDGGSPPSSGTALVAGDSPAGVVTSSGRSPWDNRPIGLAMVRAKLAASGTKVTWDGGGEGVLSNLPMRGNSLAERAGTT